MPRTPEITHKIMSSIKSKDTKPELLIRSALWKKGLRYRVNCKTFPGKPDIVFTKAKIAVFCDGDFWHGHNWAIRGMKNLEEEFSHYSVFWVKKITSNIERDIRNTKLLQDDGWTVIRLWESDIIKDVVLCANKIVKIYRDKIDTSSHKIGIETPFQEALYADEEQAMYDELFVAEQAPEYLSDRTELRRNESNGGNRE